MTRSITDVPVDAHQVSFLRLTAASAADEERWQGKPRFIRGMTGSRGTNLASTAKNMNALQLLLSNANPGKPEMKRRTDLMKLDSYAPGTFLDGVESRMQLKNDAALARKLEVAPALLSRVRNRHLPISATLLLSIHESTQIAIAELRRMMGDSRRLFS